MSTLESIFLNKSKNYNTIFFYKKKNIEKLNKVQLKIRWLFLLQKYFQHQKQFSIKNQFHLNFWGTLKESNYTHLIYFR